MKLKLFVWEGVLTDYTDGLVCILARDEAHAWRLLKRKDPTAWWTLQGQPRNRRGEAIRPRVINRPGAFLVWGGS